MKAAFFKITEEKQNRIVRAAMDEFAHHSFNEASLNNIIKVAEISKGGMFKYIEDKTDLYLYAFEIALEAFFKNQMDHLDLNEACYVSRLFKMVINSKNFYTDSPLYFQLMIQGSIDFNSPCYDQLEVIRHELLKDQKEALLTGVDWTIYNCKKEEVISYVSTLFQGINIRLLQLLTGDGFYDIEGYFDGLDKLKAITLHGMRGA